jgi:hypothetical protein
MFFKETIVEVYLRCLEKMLVVRVCDCRCCIIVDGIELSLCVFSPGCNAHHVSMSTGISLAIFMVLPALSRTAGCHTAEGATSITRCRVVSKR